MARACLNDRARGERPGAASPCFQVDMQAQPSQGETEDRRAHLRRPDVTAHDRSSPAVQGAPGAKVAVWSCAEHASGPCRRGNGSLREVPCRCGEVASISKNGEGARLRAEPMAGHRVDLRKQPIWGLAEARVTGTVTCALGDIRIRSLGIGPVAALTIFVKLQMRSRAATSLFVLVPPTHRKT